MKNGGKIRETATTLFNTFILARDGGSSKRPRLVSEKRNRKNTTCTRNSARAHFPTFFVLTTQHEVTKQVSIVECAFRLSKSIGLQNNHHPDKKRDVKKRRKNIIIQVMIALSFQAVNSFSVIMSLPPM